MPATTTLGLDVRDLRFRYSRSDYELAIESLSIAAGERVVIIGPSGSGKTTLLHLFAGILLADSGTIRVAGQALDGLAPKARRDFRSRNIGMIFQEFELFEHLTVRENILLPYYVSRSLHYEPALEKRVQALASFAGIDALLARKPRRLSQGERQRVAICRALIANAPVILADEPTGNLDPATSIEVLDAMFDEMARAHADDAPATLVLVTHDHTLLDRFDRVIDFATLRKQAR